MAVTVDGDEDEDTIAKIADLKPAFILLNPLEKLSHLHSSRRVFEILKKNDLDTAVIHHMQVDIDDSNELALELGTKVGSLLTDGDGDGVLIEQVGDKKHFSVDFLRTTSFSLYKEVACVIPRLNLYHVLHVEEHCLICKRQQLQSQKQLVTYQV